MTRTIYAADLDRPKCLRTNSNRRLSVELPSMSAAVLPNYSARRPTIPTPAASLGKAHVGYRTGTETGRFALDCEPRVAVPRAALMGGRQSLEAGQRRA